MTTAVSVPLGEGLLRRQVAAARPYARDALVAVVLAGVSVAALAGAEDGASPRDADGVALVLALLLTLPLAARRRWPLPVFLVVLVGLVAYDIAQYPSVNVDFFGPVLALYTVAAERRRLVSMSAAGLLLVVVILLLIFAPLEEGSSPLTVAVFVLGTWLLGDSARQRRETTEALERQTVALEAARADLAEQAVTQERLRIARELHDVVAHHMSAASVQASVALDRFEADPAAGRAAIISVQTLSRSALREMRQILGVLRERDDERGALSPTPGVDDLHALCAQMRASGLAVTLDLSVEGELPAAVALTVYRVVQESLTNVLRHAAVKEARVRVSEVHGAIEVEVQDLGGPSATSNGGGAGVGLVGMRERLALLGGSIEAGPNAQGFHVLARIPVREDA